MELTDEQVQQLVHAAQTGRNINNVTHDINNSLGAIMAYADLMHMDAADDESKKMLESIMACVKSSADLLGKLTTISRMAKPDSQRPCSVIDALEAVELLFAYEIKLMRIDYALDLGEALPAVDVSLPLIQRILMHLMANAVECERAGERRSISVKVVQMGDVVRVAFINAGLWEAECDAAQWFIPGYTTKVGHAGMGLSVSKALVNSIGATLDFDTSLGWCLEVPVAH